MKTWIARPAAVAGAALLAGSLAVTTASAAPAPHAAPHNLCHVREEVKNIWPLEPQYRVAAECSYINPADKARGVLDLVWQNDGHTPWFTDTGVVYYSDWRTPLIAVEGVRMEYAPR
jgi:hypothetical protein